MATSILPSRHTLLELREWAGALQREFIPRPILAFLQFRQNDRTGKSLNSFVKMPKDLLTGYSWKC